MENYFRIIYALCIIFIQFPSYYLKPINTYKNIDINFCNDSIKDYIYNSEYTKECNSLNYSKELDKPNIEDNIKQFLCLGIYDTMYKVCQDAKLKKLNAFHSQEEFDKQISNTTKLYTESKSSNELCNNLARYMPKYDKLKPELSKLTDKFKKPETCFYICFNLDYQLNPLCTILEWISKTDQKFSNTSKVLDNVVKINIKGKNENLNVTVNADHNDSSHDHQEINNSKLMANKTLTTVENDTPKLLKNNTSKSVENKTSKIKEEETYDTDKPIISNKGNKSEITNNNNNDQQEKSSQTKDNEENVTDKLNSVTSDPTIKAISQSISNPMINNVEDSHDKSVSLLNNADKKVINDNIQSQEPPPNTEKDDSMIENEEQENLEKNTKVNLPATSSVNPPDTETNDASTDTFNNQSDDQKNVSPINDADQSGGADNLSESISGPSERRDNFENEEESHFLFYFAVISIGFIGGYTGYHNKKKLLAILLKGRRSKNNRNRRRPSTANYKPLNNAKLDCTLEEAVTSPCNTNVTHVIY